MSHSNILEIKFFVKKSRIQNNYVPIYARIKFGGLDADMSIKKDIQIDQWDPESNRAHSNSDAGRAFNNELELVRMDIFNCYADLKFERVHITAEGIRNRYKGEKPEEHTLGSLIKYHETVLVKKLTRGTAKNYPSTIKHLKKFLSVKKKITDIPLAQINYTFLVDFQIFLSEYSIDPRRSLAHNGALKHIERFKKLMNEAFKNEWIPKDPFVNFEAHKVETEPRHLQGHELIAIESKVFSTDRLNRVKDMFLFSCYTGLAFCDAMAAGKQHITIGMDGYHWISMSRQKTRRKTTRTFSIPLLPKALALIKKYENDPKALAAGTLFGKLSNKTMNEYLHEIAEICGIQTELTFHVARHTFAIIVTLTHGVPLETVSKMLGHSSIKTTEIYAKVIKQKISTDMRALLSAESSQVKNAVAN